MAARGTGGRPDCNSGKRPKNDVDRHVPAAIDLHLDREGFNTIDLRLRRKWPDYGGHGGGQNTGKHGGLSQLRSVSKIETKFLLDGLPTRSRFSSVSLFGAGQFAAVIQVLQSVAELAQHNFGMANLAIQVRPGCGASSISFSG